MKYREIKITKTEGRILKKDKENIRFNIIK